MIGKPENMEKLANWLETTTENPTYGQILHKAYELDL